MMLPEVRTGYIFHIFNLRSFKIRKYCCIILIEQYMRYIHGNYITNNISVALFGIVVKVVGGIVAV